MSPSSAQLQTLFCLPLVARALHDGPCSPFQVTLKSEALVASLRIINLDTQPFDFTAALHTYFRVSNPWGLRTSHRIHSSL